ncbi:hypothetical protein BRM1_06210 [Brevibacterium sp. BRM-1]|uniref:SCO6745 family protein n=1 Tax=Brevibacterium sp. BRM-1 TaxID=2999062 RepID=UPI00228028D9|nr:hypothetical protein [Brevibacterium sp. BRM-1]WAL41432.1 hypothetical protein BRM1_06210 [Brevibacterium sp. BRM-1]
MVDTRRADLIRKLTKRLESVHSAGYFSPAVARAVAEAGIEHPGQAYLAGRAAPMGAVRAAVVTAAFYNFSPEHVRRFVPACWEIASPERIWAARVRGTEAMLAHLFLGEGERDHSELAAAAAQLGRALQPVLAAQLPDGRPLYAAHQEALAAGVQAEDPAVQPFLDLWSVATLLREYRGDGHIAALVVNYLPGLQALALHTATGTSFRPEAARKSRGWSAEQWAQAQESLRARGLLVGAGEEAEPTAAAAGLREQIEAQTDASVAVAFSPLDDEALADAAEAAKDFARVVVRAQAFPAQIFAPGSGMTRG